MKAVRWILACYSPVLVYIENVADSKDEKLRKSLLVPVILTSAVTTMGFMAVASLRGSWLALTSASVQAFLFLSFLAYVLTTKTCPQHVVGTMACAVGTVAAFGDFAAYGIVEHYTTSIIVMDVLLLCNCHAGFTHWMLGMTALVIVVSWAEQFYATFGIYDAIPESLVGFSRPGRKQKELAVDALLLRLAVFTLDFAMTRYFSKGM
eukprot:Sspe_Gene.104247::Locus_80251_Transcript_1_1_Confidence_1.000_Length_660::g.104247::m.104247